MNKNTQVVKELISTSLMTSPSALETYLKQVKSDRTGQLTVVKVLITNPKSQQVEVINKALIAIFMAGIEYVAVAETILDSDFSSLATQDVAVIIVRSGHDLDTQRAEGVCRKVRDLNSRGAVIISVEINFPLANKPTTDDAHRHAVLTRINFFKTNRYQIRMMMSDMAKRDGHPTSLHAAVAHPLCPRSMHPSDRLASDQLGYLLYSESLKYLSTNYDRFTKFLIDLYYAEVLSTE